MIYTDILCMFLRQLLKDKSCYYSTELKCITLSFQNKYAPNFEINVTCALFYGTYTL